MVLFLLFILGACFGSFFGVYIARTCKNEKTFTKEKVFSPKRSYCPECLHNIAWYDNIPLISYLLLKGKCRNCKEKIPFKYFLIEFFCGLTSLLLYVFYVKINQAPIMFFVSLIFTYAMIVLSIIDIKVFIIPDEISLGGIVCGVLFSILYPQLHAKTALIDSLLASLLGAAVGGGILFLIAFVGSLILKKEAMGGGDIKLLAMIGAFLGWHASLVVLFLASLLGVIVSLGFILAQKKNWHEQIPFGPYLAAASVIVMLIEC